MRNCICELNVYTKMVNFTIINRLKHTPSKALVAEWVHPFMHVVIVVRVLSGYMMVILGQELHLFELFPVYCICRGFGIRMGVYINTVYICTHMRNVFPPLDFGGGNPDPQEASMPCRPGSASDFCSLQRHNLPKWIRIRG